jgi:hypothetical protein
LRLGRDLFDILSSTGNSLTLSPTKESAALRSGLTEFVIVEASCLFSFFTTTASVDMLGFFIEWQ